MVLDLNRRRVDGMNWLSVMRWIGMNERHYFWSVMQSQTGVLWDLHPLDDHCVGGMTSFL